MDWNPIHLDPAVLGIGSILVGLVVYFLKKTDRKIDETSEKLDELNKDIIKFRAEVTTHISTVREDIKEDMIEVFNAACHERQSACSKLQDAKLTAIESREHTICAKIARLEAERKDDWGEQRKWNQRWEDKIVPPRHPTRGEQDK